jgi:SAM-dependent methyltransferase
MIDKQTEVQQVKERYARRQKQEWAKSRYNPLNHDVYLSQQEKQRALISLLKQGGMASNVDNVSVLEIGCGYGNNLRELIQLGFNPNQIVGNELLEDRVQGARSNLPAATQVLWGDALDIDFPPESFDLVYQSTVFSSLLDLKFQDRLAERMWDLVKPGGAVLWYDMIFDNPSNPDVKGISLTRIKELFPQSKIIMRRITLAPPISRRIVKISPVLHSYFNAIPWLRTHVLCWIQKI